MASGPLAAGRRSGGRPRRRRYAHQLRRQRHSGGDFLRAALIPSLACKPSWVLDLWRLGAAMESGIADGALHIARGGGGGGVPQVSSRRRYLIPACSPSWLLDSSRIGAAAEVSATDDALHIAGGDATSAARPAHACAAMTRCQTVSLHQLSVVAPWARSFTTVVQCHVTV